jgi:SAM-dependent methyltransferase
MEAGGQMALVRNLAKPNGQIKSRDRVRDLAEVYTHEREVNAMLDLVPDMFPSTLDPGNTDRIFLEPACGNGNFLIEILRRKLRFVTPQRYGRGERFEHRALRCLVSVYGIDICEENVRESRERMRAILGMHAENQLGDDGPTAGFTTAVEVILATNVVCADALAEATEIELVSYEHSSQGTFVREWSRPLDPDADEPSLFSAPLRRDELPVHYADLARQAEPTVADSLHQKAAA